MVADRYRLSLNEESETVLNERSASMAAGVSGLAAVLAYVTATILGGILRPGYSHVANDISKLTEAAAPHRGLLARMYGAYNLLLSVFATCLYVSTKRSRLFTLGLALMLVNCVSGVLQVTVLRRDPDGVPLSTVGKGHIVGAGISSLCTVVASFVLGFAFRRDVFWRPLSRFSLACAIAIVVTGPITGVGAATRSKVMGLLERITIGLFLFWVSVVSGYALLRSRKH